MLKSAMLEKPAIQMVNVIQNVLLEPAKRKEIEIMQCCSPLDFRSRRAIVGVQQMCQDEQGRAKQLRRVEAEFVQLLIVTTTPMEGVHQFVKRLYSH